jgi:hypothetical protein
MAGISRPEPLAFIIERLQKMKPSSVLDIGAGFGMLGVLVRCYVDNWFYRADHPSKWKTRLDYADVYSPFVKDSFQPLIYNSFFDGGAFDERINLDIYDLVMCFDVLQHLNEADGVKLLAMLKGRRVLMSCPLGDWIRRCPNKWESHISKWSNDQIVAAGFKSVLIYSQPDGRKLGLYE